jgi:hypothetical protein
VGRRKTLIFADSKRRFAVCVFCVNQRPGLISDQVYYSLPSAVENHIMHSGLSNLQVTLDHIHFTEVYNQLIGSYFLNQAKES